MSIFAVVILAVIQGLTEFLPVSSSGHLALAGIVINVPREDIIFEIVVHLGTLVAVISVYWKDLAALLTGLMRRDQQAVRMIGLLALGSVPAAAAGFFLSGSIEALFDDPLLVSLMLIVTGSVLYGTKFLGKHRRERPTWAGSFIIGVSQAMALLPGISRSGLTISTGLFAGVRRDNAARFSFLLSIPAIMGAAMLKLSETGGVSVLTADTAVGFAVSALTGYLALKVLLRFVKKGKLSVFSWYCWLLGLTGLTLIVAGV